MPLPCLPALMVSLLLKWCLPCRQAHRTTTGPAWYVLPWCWTCRRRVNEVVAEFFLAALFFPCCMEQRSLHPILYVPSLSLSLPSLPLPLPPVYFSQYTGLIYSGIPLPSPFTSTFSSFSSVLVSIAMFCSAFCVVSDLTRLTPFTATYSVLQHPPPSCTES